MDTYFSDRELGAVPRVLDELPDAAWGGIVAAFDRHTDAHLFAEAFPQQCPEGKGICGTSRANLVCTLVAHIPSIGEGWPRSNKNPGTIAAMDLVEFGWRYASAPTVRDHHAYPGHDHYGFDAVEGRRLWRDEISQILARNGIALELDGTGRVNRIGPPSAQLALAHTLPPTGDSTLDALVETAVRKFRNPDPQVRREGLDPLWDALERIKTVVDPVKKEGVTALIAKMTPDVGAQALLEAEFVALTQIGNTFHIRHYETTKLAVAPELVDYLFVRAYSLIDPSIRALAS